MLDRATQEQYERERRLSHRLLAITGVPAVTCVVLAVFLPEPWKWVSLTTGLILVLVGILADILYIGPRQLRRLRHLNEELERLLQQGEEAGEEGVEDNRS